VNNYSLSDAARKNLSDKYNHNKSFANDQRYHNDGKINQ
jgi:hypothetical protein